jgi:hypothetical protein
MNYKEAACLIADNLPEAISLAKEKAKLNEVIIPPAGKEERLFVVEEKTYPYGKISPLEVVGTYHPDYQGLTWEEFLYKGKRMKLNFDLLKHNPDYYFSDEIKLPLMSFIRINGRLFVRDDGNHRTAIARLLFTLIGEPERPLQGVLLVEIRIDTSLYEEYKKFVSLLKELNPKIPPVVHVYRVSTERVDAVEVKDVAITRYEIGLEVMLKGQMYKISNLTPQKLRVFSDGVKKFIEFKKLPFWKRLFKQKLKIDGPEDWKDFLRTVVGI